MVCTKAQQVSQFVVVDLNFFQSHPHSKGRWRPKKIMPVHVRPTSFRGLPGVLVGNETISITVLTGGGHIACIKSADVDLNPLFEPDWPTTTPALRKLVGAQFSQAPEDALESELLACICGHNLCCDVFGGHSKGEVAGGASFHGEAGMCTWTVTEVGSARRWGARLHSCVMRLPRLGLGENGFSVYCVWLCPLRHCCHSSTFDRV